MAKVLKMLFNPLASTLPPTRQWHDAGLVVRPLPVSPEEPTMSLRHSPLGRRQFLKGSASALAAAALGTSRVALGQETKGATPRFEFCAFEKFLQKLSYDELADTLAELGFSGVEATVRSNGHVKPEAVEEELPRMHEALAKRGLGITIMTTEVLRADDPLAQKVLQAATKLGIKRYRTGNFRYNLKKDILAQLDGWRGQLKELAAYNGELGIQGLYQNHSGVNYVGATVWDVHRMIHDLPASQLGIAFDIRHATIEAGLAWEVLYRVAKPHIGALYFKDFVRKGRRAEHAPLGSGVDPAFYGMVLRDNLQVPLSLHVEYLPSEGIEANVEALRRDFATLKKMLKVS
jgi:sugar phosphate isomerase/epimerase